MAVWDSSTKWRQGHFLSRDAIKVAGIDETEADQVVVVISHDCDLAQSPDVEPSVEVIVGKKIGKPDGNYAHAKNVRRLHLNCSAGDQGTIVELSATEKRLIPKESLLHHGPEPSHGVTPDELTILQRWLAARYYRSAFPDEFNLRLRDTGVEAALRKISTKHGVYLRGIFFDVDGGIEVERDREDDTYTLNVVLVYDTDHDADLAQQRAEEAGLATETAFAEKCRSGWVWKNIELQSCEVMSDHAITFRQSLSLKEWRSEHVSLKAKPQQPSMFMTSGKAE